MGNGEPQTTISFEDHLFGRLAVSLELVTPAALSRCLSRLEVEGGQGSLAQLMLREGLLNEEQVAAVMRIHRKKRGKHRGLRSVKEEEHALVDALLAEGRATLEDLEGSLLERDLLARRHLQVHLGEVLVNRGVIDGETARRLLRAIRGEVRRCGRCDQHVRIRPGVPESRWICPRCAAQLEPVGFLQLVEADCEIV